MLALLAWPAASGAEGPSLSPPADPLRDTVHQMVFLAVLDGCFSDGIAREDIDLILPKNPDTGGTRLEEHFIWSCPLCMPVVDALRCFRERGRFLSDKAGRDAFGAGLKPELRARLRSADREVRLGALQELVATWVGRRFALMRLADDERISWNAAVESRVALGMQRLRALKAGDLGDDYRQLYQGWGDHCPVCDGIMEACRSAPAAPAH
jgi:hypothetical protein